LTGPVSVGLHLGVHKTATTHLQHSLRDSREALVAAGVRYYGPDSLRLRGRSIEQMFGLGKSGRQRRSVADQIAFLAKSGHRILLSEENFAGRPIDGNGAIVRPVYPLASERVRALAAKLAAEEVAFDLFLSIRSPATYVTSSYSQALLGGYFTAPAEFAARNPPTSIDWTGFVRSLAEIPHLRRFIVWRYEDYAAVLPEILNAMMGFEAASVVKLSTAIANQGLSAQALDRFLEARASGNASLTPAQARNRFPVGPNSPPFGLFGPEELKYDRARYEKQIASIAKISGVELLAPKVHHTGQG
jgi:hypothetical protein